MDMKQKLIAVALLLTLTFTVCGAQPKHRHNAVITVVDSMAVNDDEGIEAYSDTTSLAEENDTDEAESVRVSHNPTDYEDPISWLESFTTGTMGVGATILAVLIVIIVLLFALMVLFGPFVVLILVLRYLIRRHNDRVSLAEKAMETGQPIPAEMMSIDKQDDEYLRRRGIRNTCIGIGLVIMFGIWGSDMLTGIGFLVLFYGVGQMLIARSSKKKNDEIKD